MDCFQDIISKLKNYWGQRGVILQEPFDVEVGAGTMCPETFLRVLGPERLTLVTDAIGALGRPPGDYMLGDFPIRVDETSVRLHDGTLAGSNLSADQAFRNLIDFTGCSLDDAVRAITLNPARLLGLEAAMGQLGAGLQADLVLLSEQLEVLLTVVNGDILYANE